MPTVPGIADATDGDTDARDAALLSAARGLDFPILIKASAGGGGRGMRIVQAFDETADAITAARREALSAFGSDRLLIERYIANPRHIEVQIFGDRHGNVLHLCERDCSVQRRHQKIVEEAPAPGLREETRAALHAAAVSLGKATGYDNAGTVEFILDAETQEFFFLEVNTRLQVEHPVTEAILGLDLVDWQIRVAAGASLPMEQSAIQQNGWSIEVRLAAEDPARNFMPQTGRIAKLIEPDNNHVRFDSGVITGTEVTPYYDSMLAKVISHGEGRPAALRRLDHALQSMSVLGPRTNLPFLRAVLNDHRFASGSHTTHIVESMTDWQSAPQDDLDLAAAALTALLGQHDAASSSPWHTLGQWRGGKGTSWTAQMPVVLIDERQTRHPLAVSLVGHQISVRRYDCSDAELFAVSYEYSKDHLTLRKDGSEHSYVTCVDHPDGNETRIYVDSGQGVRVFRLPDGLAGWKRADQGQAATSTQIVAPGPGAVVSVAARAGDKVRANAALLVIESMKMVETLVAPRAAVIGTVLCEPGQAVAKGDVLVELEPNET